MKEEIILKIQTIQSRIKKTIEFVKDNKCEEDIITQINKSQKILSSVRGMVIKDHLTKITRKTSVSKKEILKYYNLTN